MLPIKMTRNIYRKNFDRTERRNSQINHDKNMFVIGNRTKISKNI